MSRATRFVATRLNLIAVTIMLLLASPTIAAPPIEDEKWHFDLSVYVWLPSIDGKLGFDLPGQGDSLEIDTATILEDLQMTGMLGFDARKNRWSAFADLIYLDMADEKSDSVPLKIGQDLNLDVGAGLEIKSWIAQVAGAYDVIRTDRANLGVLLGVRYFSMETDLAIQIDGPLPPELPTDEFSKKGVLWDGIVGIKGAYGRKWYVPYYLDLGAGSSEFTWQAMTGFGYHWHWGSVFAVYRYLSFDEGDDAFIRALNIGGPSVGVKIRL